MLNRFLTFIYKKNINSIGLKKYFWKVIRKILIKIFPDGECRMSIHNLELLIPFNHPLPIYLNDLEFHDKLLSRLSNYLGEKLGAVYCIDLGANIGDSIAAMMSGRENNENDLYIGVEPTSKFFNILQKNMPYKNVICKKLICSDKEKFNQVKFNEANGTANISMINKNNMKETNYSVIKTIDKLITEEQIDKLINLIKIDTDGHDFNIIKGAKNCLNKNKPAVLMEIDNFDNNRFLDDVNETIELFISSGYNSVLIYDNTGLLMGIYDLKEKKYLDKLLFYKLTKKYYYYDFLFLRDELIDEFYLKEKSYYINNIYNLNKIYMI